MKGTCASMPGACGASRSTGSRLRAPRLFDRRPTRGARPALPLDIYSYCIYIYSHYMTRKVLHSFYLDPDLTVGLRVAAEAEYMPQSQIVRVAIREWLRRREYLPKRSVRKGGMKKR